MRSASLPSLRARLQYRRITMASRPLASRIPARSWDSHMHVVDVENFALCNNPQYTPHSHTLPEAQAFEASVGLSNIVLVQPSIYGTDNACLLAALRELGPARACGVVVFDPKDTRRETLRAWHAAGVRGVRVNLVSVGKSMDMEELRSTLGTYAEVIREFGWCVQLYLPMAMIDDLERAMSETGVRVCIDHFGQPDLAQMKGEDPYTLPGFGALVRLLKGGRTFVKLSAPYRISKRDDLSDLEPVAKEILKVAGRDRVVFSTDWPHTRYDGLDIRPFMQKVLEWSGDDELLVDRLFRGNAEDLWAVESS
ncbi:putative TIM barrel metal-dependent hydrolase [Xylariaceae sp. FL0016]|nr:putative TIM barrel metal-dependent hydrolase [Xylariaceae sp. FL0016]